MLLPRGRLGTLTIVLHARNRPVVAWVRLARGLELTLRREMAGVMGAHELYGFYDFSFVPSAFRRRTYGVHPLHQPDLPLYQCA